VVKGRFREALESQKKGATPLLYLVHSDDLKCNEISGPFSAFSFKGLLFEFLSLTVKVRFIEWYLMLQSRKFADNSTARSSWIHERPYVYLSGSYVGAQARHGQIIPVGRHGPAPR
jgi:hypothetical protein